MDITSIQKGLSFCGRVNAHKQTYDVFETEDSFWLLSFKPSDDTSGNFNLVGKEAVAYVHKRFAGRADVTAKDVMQRARRTRHAQTQFAPLNILYVLVAQGAATITATSYSHNQLRFSIRRKPESFSRRNLETCWLKSLPKGYCASRFRFEGKVHYLLVNAAGKAKEGICPDDDKKAVMIWSCFKPGADYARTIGRQVSVSLYARKRFQFAVDGNLRHTVTTDEVECETKPPKT